MEGKDCDQCEMENDDNVSSDSDDMSEYELPLAKLPQKRKHQSSDESSSSDQEADEPPENATNCSFDRSTTHSQRIWETKGRSVAQIASRSIEAVHYTKYC